MIASTKKAKMAPRKEKVDKTSTGGGNAEALIVNYLSEFSLCFGERIGFWGY